MENFDKQKSQAVSGIDFSRKGSIDSKIYDLIVFINNLPDFFTTSSCSGRIILFDDNIEGKVGKVTKKQGCQWLFTSHEICEASQLTPVLTEVTGDCVFKFEPFVLHVQCRTLEHAQSLLQCAVQSGFRNSGISLGKKGKFIVGVRSTHAMEVPLSKGGHVLVSTEYVEFLTELANNKMEENFRRIERFFDNLKQMIASLEDIKVTKSTKIKSKVSENPKKGLKRTDNTQSTSSCHTAELCDTLDEEIFSMFDNDVT